MPSDVDIYNVLRELSSQIAEIKTTQDRVLAPHSKESIKRWKDYDLLNLPEKFDRVEKLNKKHDQTHVKIDNLENKIEQLTLRSICVEEKDNKIRREINKKVDKLAKDQKIFKLSLLGVSCFFLLIYTKIIFVDHENLTKLIAIFFA